MIPKGNDVFNHDFTILKQPSKTYALDIEKGIIRGYCDGLEAVKQAVYKTLNTERYDWLIYSWNHGVELKDLFGKPISYVIPRLKTAIEEALKQDDRITEVKDFSIEKTGRNVLTAHFTVVSTEGDFESEVKVNV